MEGMTFEEYIRALKSRKGRPDKFKPAYTRRQAYYYFCHHRKNGVNSITEEEYVRIYNALSDALREKFLKYGSLHLGRLGDIELIKKRTTVYNHDGKIVQNYPIDWPKTNMLHFCDEEARRKHIYVNNVNNKFSFKIKYRSSNARIKNSKYLSFRAFQSFRSEISKRIKENRLDALMYDND